MYTVISSSPEAAVEMRRKRQKRDINMDFFSFTEVFEQAMFALLALFFYVLCDVMSPDVQSHSCIYSNMCVLCRR
jgi:hypothetical protein